MESFTFGIEALSRHTDLLRTLKGTRVALLGHPASVDGDLTPSVDRLRVLSREYGFTLSALFGPQHGFSGEKQDNMIESDDAEDAALGIQIFSLYGKTRRLTKEMIDSFDVILVDLQDVGVRVYTFLTTMCYLMEDLCAYSKKSLIVLDRPNPTGRAMDGLTLEAGWESFVGITSVPMQHGLTLGEFAGWYKDHASLSVPLKVVPMAGYTPNDVRNAWPAERIWVQPSPNMPALYTARPYAGTVIIEGTTLSEARGTTRPLSMVGHPDVDWDAVERWLQDNAGEAIKGCHLRRVVFQPTFHKHAGVPTPGFEIITEGRFYDPALFQPYLLIAAILKAIRIHHPDLPLWTDPPYEYEFEKKPIDVITGGQTFRDWVESERSTVRELSDRIAADIAAWRDTTRDFLLY